MGLGQQYGPDQRCTPATSTFSISHSPSLNGMLAVNMAAIPAFSRILRDARLAGYSGDVRLSDLLHRLLFNTMLRGKDAYPPAEVGASQRYDPSPEHPPRGGP